MWSLLLLAATMWSFAHMPLGISDRNKILSFAKSYKKRNFLVCITVSTTGLGVELVVWNTIGRRATLLYWSLGKGRDPLPDPSNVTYRLCKTPLTRPVKAGLQSSSLIVSQPWRMLTSYASLRTEWWLSRALMRNWLRWRDLTLVWSTLNFMREKINPDLQKQVYGVVDWNSTLAGNNIALHLCSMLKMARYKSKEENMKSERPILTFEWQAHIFSIAFCLSVFCIITSTCCSRNLVGIVRQHEQATVVETLVNGWKCIWLRCK